jgi:hypothetical protein
MKMALIRNGKRSKGGPSTKIRVYDKSIHSNHLEYQTRVRENRCLIYGDIGHTTIADQQTGFVAMLTNKRP